MSALLKTPEGISDIEAEKIGATLARVLQLKKSKQNKGRWETTGGDKSNLGLYRTVYAILESSEHFVD